MLKLVDRYIARQVIVSSLLILLLLASLRSLFSFLDELNSLQGNYQLSDALLYVGLMFPGRILDFFPMSVLIGALFGLGNMASNSELTVMRAAGMTTWRIAGSTIKASFLLMVMVIIVSESVVPISSKAAQQLRTSAISGGELSFSKTGLWAKRQEQVIQIGNVLNNGQLADITLYQTSAEKGLISIINAERALRNEQQWILENVTETRFYDERVETKRQDSRLWLNPLMQSQIDTLTLEPETLNLKGLLSYIDYSRQNGLQSKNLELALWRKVMQPLAIAVMMFLAASFVFGPMRDVSTGARILSGVMLGFVFHLTNQSFGPISLVYNFWPWLGAILPLVLFSFIGYWLMKRNH